MLALSLALRNRGVRAAVLAMGFVGLAPLAHAEIFYAQYQWEARTGVWPASGGRGSIAVNATSDTNWSISGLPTWISVVSGSPWVGSGIVSFQVAENTGPARNVTLSVGSYSFDLHQAGGECETSIGSAVASYGSSGARERSVNVSGGACQWSAYTGEPWLTVHTTFGYGSKSVLYSVEASDRRRSGAIVAGSSVLTVDQDGADGCSFVPSPLYYDFPATGGIGSFDLFLNKGCNGWSATSDSPWVQLQSASGSGSGTVRYVVEANPHDSSRQAVLVVNGQPHFVTQAASPTPGVMTIQPGPVDGQDTSYGTVYFTGGTPDDPSLTYGGSNDAFSNLFQFDLSGSFPAGHVGQVLFQFHVTHKAPMDPQLALYRLTEPWTEAGASLARNPAGEIIGYLPAPQEGWNTVDVTDLYRRWKTGGAPNYGLMIATVGVPYNARGYLASSEHSDPTKRPRLVLSYREEAVGSVISSNQRVRVVGGSGYQELYYNYATQETWTTPYTYDSGTVPLPVPADSWVGVYHYDYASGRFTQGVYTGRHTLQ